MRSQDKDGGNSERGSSVTSGKRAGLLAALVAPGVPGMYREEKPQRKSPEPVSFIKSDKLFLTIALFLLFYNAVIWNGAPLFEHRKQVMNEPGDQAFFTYTSLMHLGDTCLPLKHIMCVVALLN